MKMGSTRKLWEHKVALIIAFGCLLAALALMPAAGPAEAACPVTGCGGGGTHTETVNATLSVTNNQTSGGKVTSSDGQINCGLGQNICSHTYSYNVTCSNDTGDCSPPVSYPTPNLSTTQASGNTFMGWGGACSGTGSCSVQMDSNKSVSAAFRDVQGPTVSLTGPANNAKFGPSNPLFNATATASDNSGTVQRVEFHLGTTLITETSTPYAAQFSIDWFPDGTYMLFVRAYDGSGNVSQSPSRSVIIDKQVSVFLVDPTPAQNSFVNAASPDPVKVGFTTDPDVPAANIQCRTTAGTTVGSLAQCSSPYTVPTSGDGSYEVEVQVTDDVGNTATAPQRKFTLDRTLPTATGKPSGRRVSPRSNVTATFSEAMKEASVEQGGTFTLKKKGSRRKVGATVVYSEPTANTFQAVLNPNRKLKAGATYIATMTSAATDLAGNPLVKKTWRFTVKG